MLLKKPVFLLLLAAMLFACKKKTEEVIVPGNTAPPDHTITNLTKETYVNKVYISLLGRKPDSTEFQQGLSIINQNNLSTANREELLDTIMAQPEYYQNFFDVAKAELISGADTNDIRDQIDIFNILLQDSQYVLLWPAIQYEVDRLELLLDVPGDLQAGLIDFPEAHRRLVNNYGYDQLNMGSLNFVVSCFQHFLDRYPTTNELDNGILMVDGFNAVFFLETGNSKDDFLDIFFNSDAYREGRVNYLYNLYLYRSPDSQETLEATELYKNTGDYRKMQKLILASDEYTGV